jgi:hypothetical protein
MRFTTSFINSYEFPLTDSNALGGIGTPRGVGGFPFLPALTGPFNRGVRAATLEGGFLGLKAFRAYRFRFR